MDTKFSGQLDDSLNINLLSLILDKDVDSATLHIMDIFHNRALTDPMLPACHPGLFTIGLIRYLTEDDIQAYDNADPDCSHDDLVQLLMPIYEKCRTLLLDVLNQ